MDKLIRGKREIQRDLPACPICDTTLAKIVYTYCYDGGRSNILRCVACGHMFLHPLPLAELNSREMKSLGDVERLENKLFNFLHRNIVIYPEIKNIRAFTEKAAPQLLDIGCGTGWTTAIWRNHGFEVAGLEPSAPRRQICQDVHHIEAFGDFIENFAPREKYDLVILRHVFEHIADPASVLQRIRDVFLNERGILLIVIPNINSIGRYLFQENWTWVLPWHLHFYNPRNLKRLLEKNGFDALKIYQTPSPLWYPDSLRKLLGEEKPWTGILTGRLRPLTTLAFLPIIALGFLLNLNDNMTLISRKK